MKKNVLQLIGSFHQGGSERQAVQLFNLLRKDATYNVFLAALENEGVLRSEVTNLDLAEIQEYRLTSFYDLNFLRKLKRFARFLRENKIDIVHAHDFYTNLFGITAARFAGIPIKIASKRETGGMRSELQKKIEKGVFKMSNAVVANAAAVKSYLIEEGINRGKIHVIYNGLDLERLAAKKTDRKLICGSFNLPGDENIKFVALVANMRHEVKNQLMFLRAAKKVSEKFSTARFVLAGEGELRGELENFAENLGIGAKTYFTGRCAEIPELLSISSAGVLTSTAEGFSNSILEYMSAKLPVVATDVGGAREAIIENETGFLVASNDDAAMADRLIELLSDENKRVAMGEKGRKTVEEKFSCEAQLKNTLMLYESQLRGK